MPSSAPLPLCRSGGMELLFGNQKAVEVDVPQQDGQVGSVRRLGDSASACVAQPVGASACIPACGPQACLAISTQPEAADSTANPKHQRFETATIPSHPCSAAAQLTVAAAMAWARDHLLTERPELFMKGDSV